MSKIPNLLMRRPKAPGLRLGVIRRKWHSLSRRLGIVQVDRPKSQEDRAGLFARHFGKYLFGDASLVPAHHERVIAALYQSLLDYASREYPGKVTLFRAAHQPFDCSHDSLMDWARLARAGVDAQTVPGSHSTILEEPRVRQLAQALVAALVHSASQSSGHARSLPEPVAVDTPQRYESAKSSGSSSR